MKAEKIQDNYYYEMYQQYQQHSLHRSEKQMVNMYLSQLIDTL